MAEQIIRTGVDELLDMLKGSPKIPLVDAAKKLKVSVDVVQAWVDFLVEERILGIEYKFTTPYIYLNTPLEPSAKISRTEDSIDVSYFKRQFWEKAKHNNIPESKIADLWKNHLLQETDLKRKYFFFEAQQRKFSDIEHIWEEYQKSLLSA